MVFAPSPYDLKFSGRVAEMHERFLADWEQEEADPVTERRQARADFICRWATEMGKGLHKTIELSRAYRKQCDEGLEVYDPEIMELGLRAWRALVPGFMRLIDGVIQSGLRVDLPEVFVSAVRELKQEMEDVAEWKTTAKSGKIAGASPDCSEHILRETSRLALLPANWDGYGAPALNQVIIEAVRRFARGALRNGTKPKVVPMSPGNLQLEWHAGPRSLELEFETPETIRYLKWDTAAGVQEEDSFPAADTAKGVALVQWFANGI